MIFLIFRPLGENICKTILSLDIDCEHESLNLPDHRQDIPHQFAFQFHTQHFLCQHRASSSWSSMSPASIYHHDNAAMTQPPPSGPKLIQGRFPETSPKPQRHLGVGGQMRWVHSHPSSLPADIQEGLTSSVWASMLCIASRHRKERSWHQHGHPCPGCIKSRHRSKRSWHQPWPLGHQGTADTEEKKLTSA